MFHDSEQRVMGQIGLTALMRTTSVPILVTVCLLLTWSSHATTQDHVDIDVAHLITIEIGINYPECEDGFVLVRVVTGALEIFECVSLSKRWPYVHIHTPAPEGYTPLPIETFYRAGICPKNLSGLPIRLGNIRHDDIESFEQEGLARNNELTSGFYPVSLTKAIIFGLKYIASLIIPQTDPPDITFTLGHLIHNNTSTFSCEPPIVNESTYKNYRLNVKTTIWKNYHLFIRNCQHWADHVDFISKS